MRLIHFPYEIFLICTSFCPTFSYYFDKTLNPVANSSCMHSAIKTRINQLQKQVKEELKGAVGSADLKISKSALLSLNHHNFSNTKPIYTE